MLIVNKMSNPMSFGHKCLQITLLLSFSVKANLIHFLLLNPIGCQIVEESLRIQSDWFNKLMAWNDLFEIPLNVCVTKIFANLFWRRIYCHFWIQKFNLVHKCYSYSKKIVVTLNCIKTLVSNTFKIKFCHNLSRTEACII